MFWKRCSQIARWKSSFTALSSFHGSVNKYNYIGTAIGAYLHDVIFRKTAPIHFSDKVYFVNAEDNGKKS